MDGECFGLGLLAYPFYCLFPSIWAFELHMEDANIRWGFGIEGLFSDGVFFHNGSYFVFSRELWIAWL
jgi:hypothetical protein